MKKLFAAILLICMITATGGAQTSTPPQITETEKAIAVRAIQTTLQMTYVFQDEVGDINSKIEEQLRSGAYDRADTVQDFADLLTKHLVEISGDDHFAVIYDPQWIASTRESSGAGKIEGLDSIEALQRSNFGFRKLEILEGNIGYVRFDFFPNPEHSFEAGAAAMRFVENADALIFDMRYNRGGYNQFGQFLSSYLFEASEEKLLLEYSYMNGGDLIDGAHWTLPALPGPRLPDIPVYILTSTTTFSAGEWFAYSLKMLGRAVIVGQQTSGASHAVAQEPIDDRFLLQVPVGQIRDPVAKGDFEGVGVAPDYDVPSIAGLAVAHKLAFEAISTRSDEMKNEYNWALPVLEARIAEPRFEEARLKQFAGAYEGRTIEFSEGRLIYHWRDRFALALTRLQPNLFAIEGVDDFRFRFVEKCGRIVALERVQKDGRVIVYPRL